MEKETIKTEIKKTYGSIAKDNQSVGCCNDSGCCATDGQISMTEDYTSVEGHVADADLSLGCGLPTEIANIKQGDTVVDLGSGAGNDAFIARRIVGESGRVIGIDMTPEMVIRALQNNQKLGYKNVDFLLGEIENMDEISNEIADVVVSNCVMNLVPDKEKAFAEISRILKIGGHFSISDIVYKGTLPTGILEAAEMYSGCVAGASEKGTYLGIIKEAGFKNIRIKQERQIQLPDELLLQYTSEKELKQFRKSDSGIYSITVYADKLENGDCCETTGGECCTDDKNANRSNQDSEGCCNSSKASCC